MIAGLGGIAERYAHRALRRLLEHADTAEIHDAFFQGARVLALDGAGELVAVTGHAYERPIRLIHLPTRAAETVHLYNEYIQAMVFDERGALFVLTLNNGIEVFGPAL